LYYRVTSFAVACALSAALTITVHGQNSQAAPPQQNKPATPAEQNAPPPPGGAQDTRAPGRPRAVLLGGNTKVYDAATVERGQKLYQSNCSFCHGANAKGGESGPSLVRSNVVLHDNDGDRIGQVVHNGRPDKGMPKFPFSDEQIYTISAFLHERVRAAAERGNYQILNIVTGDPKKGEAYFNGQGRCNSCHSVTGDLAHIASRLEPVDLQQHIVMPRQGRGNHGESGDKNQQVTVTVTLPSSQSVKGSLASIDDFTVALVDESGEYRSFPREGDTPKVELHDPLQAHTDLLAKYTDTDIHNLTAYLATLK
jgi:cytochrome c oxidase cbb3-type subunit 3